ncbi:hypothetical protein ACFZAM_31615 [Streptomyces sp. NPDC008079]|uniref:hypothetical protein n=1 Tax=Streptomyces sp. NPDC008079 TaxID=3364806 RepID=UPI0036E9989E
MADTPAPETVEMLPVTWDGRGEHWTVTVCGNDGRQLLQQTYEHWTDFRPASAGHRLIEHGYMPNPERYLIKDAVASWTEVEEDRLYTGEVYRLAPPA